MDKNGEYEGALPVIRNSDKERREYTDEHGLMQNHYEIDLEDIGELFKDRCLVFEVEGHVVFISLKK